MSCALLSEDELITIVSTICKEHVTAPNVLVAKREILGGIARKVTIVCVVPVGLEELVNKLVFNGLDNDYQFTGSEINLQDGMNTDYIYITAEVSATK